MSAYTIDWEVVLMVHQHLHSESYAGIYVPNLARAVAEGNDAGAEPFINIVGYMVGNGVTDSEVDGDAFVPFAAGKSLISREMHHDLLEACGGTYWNKTYGKIISMSKHSCPHHL